MDKIRNFMQSFWGKMIMVAMMLPMMFMGVQGTFGDSSIQPNQLVKVGDQFVEVGTYQAQINAMRNELLQKVDASLINEDVLAQQVLDNLINQVLIEHQALALGMTVSDETITRLLQQEQNFHDENGQFSNEKFAEFLQSQNMTKDELFATFRTQLSLRQLNSSIVGTAIYPNSQISHLLDLQLEAREVWVHRFKWQDYAVQIEVTDAQIQEYFNKNKDSLIKPATVDLSYVELMPETVKISPPTEDEIAAQYPGYLKDHGISDGRELAQILLTGDQAAKQAQEVKTKLDAGGSFEALAKQYSQDPSGKTGGYIGAFNPAVFGAEAASVEKALAGLRVGQVSQPVKTSFGYQIFKIVNINSSAPSIDSLRTELTQRAEAYKRQAVFAELANKINTMATDGVGVADIAKEVGVELKQIKAYPKTDNQTQLPQPAVIAAAFDEFTIQDQSVSANIELSDRTVWVQPSNYQASRPLTLQEASEQIKLLLTKQAATKLAMADAQKMADSAKATGVNRLKVPSANMGLVTRAAPTLNSQESASLFLHQSAEGDDVWAVETSDGASVMVGGKVEKSAQSQLSAIDRLRTMKMLRENVGADQLLDYLQYLRDTKELVINEDALKAQH